MRSKLVMGMMLMLLVPGLLTMVSCRTKIKSDPSAGTQTGVSGTGETDAAADAAARQREIEARELSERLRSAFINEDIYFDFDQSVLTSAAQRVLRDKAEYMKANPDITAIVEGHCDERGTPEYNIALGDRRAKTTKQFMVDLGITARRLNTISYGEEKPVDPGRNEAAWAKNRRAHFVIQ